MNSIKPLLHVTRSALRADTAIDPVTTAWLVAVLVINQFSFRSALERSPTQVLLGIAGVAVTAICLLVATPLRRRLPANPVVTIGLLVVAGLAAGLVTIPADGPHDFNALLQYTIFTVAAAILIGTTRYRFARNRSETVKTFRLRQQLQVAQEQTARSIVEYRTTASRFSLEQVGPALQEGVQRVRALAALPSLSADQLRSTASWLRATGEKTVRPASHQLAELPAPLPTSPPTVPAPPPDTSDLLNWALFTRPVQPIGTALISLLLSIGLIRTVDRWPAVLAGVLLLAVVLELGRRLLLPLTTRSRAGRTFAVVITWVLAGLIVSLPSYLSHFVFQGTPGWVFMLLTVVEVCGIAAILAMVAGSLARSQVDLQRQRGMLLAMQWEQLAAEQELEAQKARLVRLLHTDVQGRLAGCALMLDDVCDDFPPAASAGFVPAARSRLELVAKALEQVQHSLAELPSPEPAADLQAGLSRLAQTWRGVVNVELHLDPAALNELTGRAVASRFILELVSEAVANATRHGHAHRVIAWLLNNGNLLIDDDGRGPSGDWRQPGLVFRQLRDAGGDCSIGRSSLGGARVEIALPQSVQEEIGLADLAS